VLYSNGLQQFGPIFDVALVHTMKLKKHRGEYGQINPGISVYGLHLLGIQKFDPRGAAPK